MTAAEWNAAYPVGTRVAVTLANGDVLTTNTASDAERIGDHDMLRLEGSEGYWLLSWCGAMEAPGAVRGPSL